MSKSRALGTKLLVDSVEVAALTAINGAEITADNIDLTALDATNGYREYDAGFKDPGEIGVDGFLDSADALNAGGQAKLLSCLNSGATVPWEVRFPSKLGLSWSGSGVVTKFSTGAELEGGVTFSAAIKVSGQPTLAATPAQSGGGT